MSRSLRPILLSPIAAASQNAGAGGHPRARLNYDFPLGPQQDIHTRAEFDEAHALPGDQPVAGLLAAYDAAGNQPGNLFEDHGGAIALHGDDVLLIGLG